MCGIVGLVNVDDTIQRSRKDWFESALFVDQLRGKDSTGIYVRPKKKFANDDAYPMAHYYKRALPASDFLRMDTVKNLLQDSDNARVVIGHNRLATQGNKYDDDGAHPFNFEGITMVHNGTLITRRGLTKHHSVDSESIAYELSQTEPQKYTSLLRELDGAYALVWDNRTEQKVYFARNSERPLWLAYGYGGKTLMYASEPWMIDQIMFRNKYLDKLDTDKNKQLMMFPLPEHELFSVDYSLDTIKLRKKKYEPLPKYQPVTTYPSTTKVTGASNGSLLYKDQKTIDLNTDMTKGQCPYKTGDHLYASMWEYDEPKKGKQRGTLRGFSNIHPNVQFVVGNITTKKNDELVSEWTDWVQAIMANDSEMEIEILLSGIVSSVSNVRKVKNAYIVNLKASTVKVEGFDYDSYDDDLDATYSSSGKVVGTTSEEEPEEKKFLPVPVNEGETYKVGDVYSSAADFLAATADGCSICGCDITLAHHASVGWVSTIVNGKEEQLEPTCATCNQAYENPTQ